MIDLLPLALLVLAAAVAGLALVLAGRPGDPPERRPDEWVERRDVEPLGRCAECGHTFSVLELEPDDDGRLRCTDRRLCAARSASPDAPVIRLDDRRRTP